MDNTTTHNQFTAIPPGLPPLPAFDSRSHWPRYEGIAFQSENGKGLYCCWTYRELGDSWSEITKAGGVAHCHYLRIVHIDYSDPCYQKYVEDACRKGEQREFQAKAGGEWMALTVASTEWNWDIFNYRVAQPQPAPEACESHYFSEEYQVELFKRWKTGEELELQSWVKDRKEWFNDRGYVRRFWEAGSFYRIKPTPPAPQLVTVPLEASDIPPGSVLSWDSGFTWKMITEKTSALIYCSSVSFAYWELMERGVIIKRPGYSGYEPCSKQAEQKG